MIKKPLFWMNKQSGKMKEIVFKFLDDKKLTDDELKTLKWYVIQWIEGTEVNSKQFLGYVSVPPEYKKKIESMNQKQLHEYIPGELLDYGIDPF